jgi:hypothetical protein
MKIGGSRICRRRQPCIAIRYLGTGDPEQPSIAPDSPSAIGRISKSLGSGPQRIKA